MSLVAMVLADSLSALWKCIRHTLAHTPAGLITPDWESLLSLNNIISTFAHTAPFECLQKKTDLLLVDNLQIKGNIIQKACKTNSHIKIYDEVNKG